MVIDFFGLRFWEYGNRCGLMFYTVVDALMPDVRVDAQNLGSFKLDLETLRSSE